MTLLLRRMKPAGDAFDLEPAEADDLVAPEITEASHGRSVGDVVKVGAAGYDLADASGDPRGLAVVVHVRDANNFSICRYGNVHEVAFTAHGLGSRGTDLALSDVTPGALVPWSTVPAGWRIYCGVVLDDDTILWEPGWIRF